MMKGIRKLAFLTIAILVLAAGTVFAQNVERNLEIYTDFNSGTLGNTYFGAEAITTPNSLLTGNEFELGIKYSQNYRFAKWLYFNVNIATIGGYNIIADTTSTPLRSTYAYDLSQLVGKIGLSGNFEALGLSGLGLYAMVDVIGVLQSLSLSAVDNASLFGYEDQGGTFEFGAAYTWDFNYYGSLKAGIDVEMSAVPFSYDVSTHASFGSGYYIADDMVSRTIDLIDINVSYNIPFATYVGFTTKLAFRFEGASAFYDAYADGSTDAADVGDFNDPSADGYGAYHLMFSQNFLASLAVRWDNTLDVTVGKFNANLGLRTEFNNLVSEFTMTDLSETETVYKQDTNIECQLLFGASYVFDFTI